MTPIRMLYTSSLHDKSMLVDIYHFHQCDDTLDVLATGWLVEAQSWITVPVFMLTPIVENKKKTLNEAKEKKDD